ncbi:metal ABC transporter solute-binding protein, Zn/Mn family [Thermodesulfobacteriota bacterium]
MTRLLYMSTMMALCLGFVLQPSTMTATERIPVFVSIVPQKYFLERLGGDHVTVSVMVRPGNNPALYEPKPNQMVALSKTRTYFAVGVPFEKVWLKKIASTNPQMQIVHTEKGIAKRSMKKHHHKQKSEGLNTSDSTIKDPHIWLSPPLVMVQARNIMRALVDIDPENATSYLSNYRNFIAEIVDLDTEIYRIFSTKGTGFSFMVFHPAWGYFAEAYGLNQLPIEFEGKEPKPAQMKQLITSARKHQTKVIFVQPQFSKKSAETIARAIGAKVVFADPLHPDWAMNLRTQAANIKAAMR